MKALLSVVALVAGFGAVQPVFAQTLDITVPGGQFEFDEPRVFDDKYVVRAPWDPGLRFDPGQAAINALNISHFLTPRGRSVFNFNRAFTLNATGDSILEHQLKCQAAFDTYDLVSDTYLGPHGIPLPCRL